MKIFWSFIFLLTVHAILAQSKKEQIKQLKLRVDSLQTVLQKEKTINNSKSEEINRLTNKISLLDADVIRLNNKLASTETQLKNSQANLDKSMQQISTLLAEIKQKTDSMETLRKEILALQPPPKPVPIAAKPVLSKGPIKTVTIGTQIWTTKNLDVSTFRNGDVIPQASSDEAWRAAGENKQPAWCYYDNDPKNGAKYGKLYNWYAVNDSRGLAPEGYHIPSDAEWTVLTDYLGGESSAGEKMKSTNGWADGFKICPKCASWNEEYRRKNSCHTCKDTREIADPGSGNGTNTSGFSGLPGGFRDNYGSFNNIGNFGFWWSSTENVTNIAWYRYLNYNNGDVSRDDYNKEKGLSVRCLRD